MNQAQRNYLVGRVDRIVSSHIEVLRIKYLKHREPTAAEKIKELRRMLDDGSTSQGSNYIGRFGILDAFSKKYRE